MLVVLVMVVEVEVVGIVMVVDVDVVVVAAAAVVAVVVVVVVVVVKVVMVVGEVVLKMFVMVFVVVVAAVLMIPVMCLPLPSAVGTSPCATLGPATTGPSLPSSISFCDAAVVKKRRATCFSAAAASNATSWVVRGWARCNIQLHSETCESAARQNAPAASPSPNLRQQKQH